MMQQTDEVGTSPKLDGMAHRVELEKWPTTKSVVGSRLIAQVGQLFGRPDITGWPTLHFRKIAKAVS
jgi:hypothetical protein